MQVLKRYCIEHTIMQSKQTESTWSFQIF